MTLNLLPSKSANWLSPWTRWATALNLPVADRKPFIKHLRIYGCTAYSYIKKESRGTNKLAPRARKGHLVGCDDDHGHIY
jgi:hypothetical protein